MNYYKTSLYTYSEFIKENNNDRLSKNEKIEQPGSGVPIYLKIDEIFNSKVVELDYKKEIYKHPKYKGEENITYFFKSKSEVDYRLDLVILSEENINLKDVRLYNKKFISISFSLSDSNNFNYDDVTNLNEIYDLMSKIKFLIDKNEYMLGKDYVFMFGKPIDKKIKMYEYFIKICFPDYKLIIDYNSGFPNTKVGYYLLK